MATDTVNPVKKIRGIVTWFNSQKGYGFLQDSKTENEYFCHFSAIQHDGYKTLKQNDKVEFSLEKGPKGKTQAADVRVVD